MKFPKLSSVKLQKNILFFNFLNLENFRVTHELSHQFSFLNYFCHFVNFWHYIIHLPPPIGPMHRSATVWPPPVLRHHPCPLANLSQLRGSIVPMRAKNDPSEGLGYCDDNGQQRVRMVMDQNGRFQERFVQNPRTTGPFEEEKSPNKI